MRMELLGWASSRAVARQFLETCNIADWDADKQMMVPREGVHLHPFRASESLSVTRDGEERAGFHFDIVIYGALLDTLIDKGFVDDPEDAGPAEGKMWDRLKVKNYIDNKLGVVAALKGKDLTGTKLPGGYEWSIGAAKVRLFDPAKVNQRAHGWA